MKDSGVAWIGEIPGEWKVLPAQRVFTEIKRKNTDGRVQKALKFKAGSIVPKTNFDADADDYVAETITSYTIVEPGTIVINGLNLNYDFKSLRTGLVKETGAITSAYLALWPESSMITPEYATYLFKGYETRMALHNMGSGIRLTLGFKEFKGQPVLLPPLDEQSRIVHFLDVECARIDAVIEKTRASIAEYKKLKQSFTIEAVTKGIRKGRAMKESGIEWLGEIPTDWTECRIKNVIFPIEKPVFTTDDVITCFRDGEVTLRKKRREEGFTFSLTEHGYHGVDVGDLVIHGMDAFAGAVGCSDSRGKTTPVVHVCETTGNNRFFMYYLRSLAYGNILMDFSNGVRIRSSDFRNFSKLGVFGIAVPPREEQDEIVTHLDSEIEKIDRLINEKNRLLAELESYKKSMIYETVTGKKEVPA